LLFGSLIYRGCFEQCVIGLHAAPCIPAPALPCPLPLIQRQDVPLTWHQPYHNNSLVLPAAGSIQRAQTIALRGPVIKTGCCIANCPQCITAWTCTGLAVSPPKGVVRQSGDLLSDTASAPQQSACQQSGNCWFCKFSIVQLCHQVMKLCHQVMQQAYRLNDRGALATRRPTSMLQDQYRARVQTELEVHVKAQEAQQISLLYFAAQEQVLELLLLAD
jgi:hypothetical protein